MWLVPGRMYGWYWGLGEIAELLLCFCNYSQLAARVREGIQLAALHCQLDDIAV